MLLAMLRRDRLTHDCRHGGCPVDVGPDRLVCAVHEHTPPRPPGTQPGRRLTHTIQENP